MEITEQQYRRIEPVLPRQRGNASLSNLNDAERLSMDPTFRLIGSQKIWERGAALTSTLHGFETRVLASDENLIGLMAVNRDLVAQADVSDNAERVILDMDSTESPVHGQQEDSAYNGHFGSVCYHPLLLFNSSGDCLAAKDVNAVRRQSTHF